MPYKCLKTDFPELQKKINRITKKLDKHHKEWVFEILPDTVEKIEIIDIRGLSDLPADQRQPKKSSIVVDVANYTFEMEPLKLGEYEVIAVLEHNSIENSNENFIYTIKDDVIIPLKYRTIKSYCEHCHSDRNRNKTILLQNPEGDIIQVGSTCIHEYTGIDGIDIIKNYQDLKSILLKDIPIDFERMGSINSKYTNTLNYLSACVQLIITKGYKKEETKWDAWTITEADEQYKLIAHTIIDYFKNQTFGECQDFLNNIKLTLSQEYCKISGFVAYAYLAYQKQLEFDEKKKAEIEHKQQSEYIGEIGKKIETELILKKRIAYESCYNGYSETTNYIYLFEDQFGNAYKWSTNKFLEKIIYTDEKKENGYYEAINENDTVKIKGTIKAHEEYKDQKQTVLTRCKIV